MDRSVVSARLLKWRQKNTCLTPNVFAPISLNASGQAVIWLANTASACCSLREGDWIDVLHCRVVSNAASVFPKTFRNARSPSIIALIWLAVAASSCLWENNWIRPMSSYPKTTLHLVRWQRVWEHWTSSTGVIWLDNSASVCSYYQIANCISYAHQITCVQWMNGWVFKGTYNHLVP